MSEIAELLHVTMCSMLKSNLLVLFLKKERKRKGMQEIVKHLPRHANDVMKSDCKRTDLAIPSAVSWYLMLE